MGDELVGHLLAVPGYGRSARDHLTPPTTEQRTNSTEHDSHFTEKKLYTSAIAEQDTHTHTHIHTHTHTDKPLHPVWVAVFDASTERRAGDRQIEREGAREGPETTPMGREVSSSSSMGVNLSGSSRASSYVEFATFDPRAGGGRGAGRWEGGREVGARWGGAGLQAPPPAFSAGRKVTAEMQTGGSEWRERGGGGGGDEQNYSAIPTSGMLWRENTRFAM
jgi:hypothetical protein